MSTRDMAAGYWQVEVDERDTHKTAFTTRFVVFEHIRMPFGLCNSPATFSRVMQLVLQGLSWKDCLAYLDDAVVLGTDFDEHLCNLSKVLSRFEKYNLKLKPKKCQLFQKEVQFLGKVVNAHGISVNPESIAAVAKWSTPKNKKDLQSFLGFANYHRDHVKHFAQLACTTASGHRNQNRLLLDGQAATSSPVHMQGDHTRSGSGLP